MALVAVVFFGFLYRDEKILNALEDRMDGVISQLPAGQRIVSGVDDPYLHVFARDPHDRPGMPGALFQLREL